MKKTEKKYAVGFIEFVAREKLGMVSSNRAIFERLADRMGCTWWTVAKYDKGTDVPFSFIVELCDAYKARQLTPKYLMDTYREYMRLERVHKRRGVKKKGP